MSQEQPILNQVWSTLSSALNDIFELRPMSPAAYMAHYKLVNDFHENFIEIVCVF